MARQRLTLVAGLLAAALLALFMLLQPLLRILLLAGMLSMALSRPFERLCRAFGGRRGLAATLLTTSLTLFGAVPLLLAILAAKEEVGASLGRAHDALRFKGGPPMGAAAWEAAQALLERGAEALSLRPEQLQEILAQVLERGHKALLSLLGASAGLLGASALTLVALFFFLRDGPALVALLLRLSPLPAAQTRRVLGAVHLSAAAAFLGTGVSAAFSAVVVGAGGWACGLPQPLTLTLLTLIAAFIPLIGSALVWGPGVLWLWAQGSHGAALVLFCTCLLGGAVSGNVVKPLVIRGGNDVPFGALLAGIFGGLALFGLLGIFVGPTLVAVVQVLTQLYLEEKEAPAPRASAASL